jgi:hypothetical protein
MSRQMNRARLRGPGGQLLVAWVLPLFAGDLYTIFIAGAFSFDFRLKPLRGFAIAVAALAASDFVRWTVESHFGLALRCKSAQSDVY